MVGSAVGLQELFKDTEKSNSEKFRVCKMGMHGS